MKCICVLGTDTEIGKTFVTASLARELVAAGVSLGVYKPVASGSLPGSGESDADAIFAAAQLSCPIERVCPQAFPAPLAPPLAARQVGRVVDESLLVEGANWWRDQVQLLLIEGAGGVLSPISDRWTCLDLAQELQRSFGPSFQILLVTEHRLGMVNQALMAIEAIQRRQLSLLGVYINCRPTIGQMDSPTPSLESNMELLLSFSHGVEYFSDIESLAKSVQS